MADQNGMCDVSEEAPIGSMTLFKCMRLDTGEDQLNKWCQCQFWLGYSMAGQIGMCDVSEEAPIRSMNPFQCMRLVRISRISGAITVVELCLGFRHCSG